MAVEENDSAEAVVGDLDKKKDVLEVLEVSAMMTLSGSDFVRWKSMTEKVLGRPDTLSALIKAAGGTTDPILSPKAKAAVLWGAGGVLVYNFVVRDLLILLLKLENTPPPAITYDSVVRLFGALFGF